MDSPDSDIHVKKVDLTPNPAPVPLPDGNEKIPLGSGVITRLLGHGGMAAVYEIWNPQLEMFRAVKIINPGSADIVHQRFQTEIKISAKLKHPNIVEIHGVGEWHGLPFIEMEKVDGIGLDEIIDKRGALPAEVCTSIGIQICRALKYAHTQDCTIYGRNYHGVIHRDLKPGNIMVEKNGEVKLMDFGIARPVEVSFHTMDGLVAGTLPYLAPEQIERKKLDVRTDLYALGASMYEVVTGTKAFPQNSFAQLVAFKTKSRFTPIESFSISIPGRLKRIICKCMQQEPQNRVASADDLLKDLSALHKKLTVKTPEEVMARLMTDSGGEKVVPSLRRRVPWKIAAILCLLAAGADVAWRFGLPAYRQYRATIGLEKSVHSTPSPAATASLTQPVRMADSGEGGNIHRIAPAMPAAARAAQNPVQKKLLETMLSEKYGIADPLEIMLKELGNKNYANVIKLYNGLPENQAKSGRALILKMHALEGAGSSAALSEFFRTMTLNDGEFYLGKAKFVYKNRDFAGCRKLLDQSLSSPHSFTEYDILKREAYFYMARCATALFDNDPNEQTYKNALDAWWQLRSALRSDPGHEYNKKAADELQRMAKKMQKG
jgi:hypothetical protein